MKSSCSATWLSMSQNLPEMAFILSVSLSSVASSFQLPSFFWIHQSTPPPSLQFVPLISVQLSNFHVCSPHWPFSSLVIYHHYEQLICNHYYFYQHLVFLMSQFLIKYSVCQSTILPFTHDCLSINPFYIFLCSPLSDWLMHKTCLLFNIYYSIHRPLLLGVEVTNCIQSEYCTQVFFCVLFVRFFFFLLSNCTLTFYNKYCTSLHFKVDCYSVNTIMP